VDLLGGEVAVVLEEVGGDSDEEEMSDKKVEDVLDTGEKETTICEVNDGESSSIKGDSIDETGKALNDEQADGTVCKKRSGSVGRKSDRESSPSSRALLKLCCKYCDSRHVTFRVNFN